MNDLVSEYQQYQDATADEQGEFEEEGEAGWALRAMRGNKAWAFIVPVNQWVGWALALMSVQNCV